MPTYNIYIGADNDTGKIDLDLIASIVSKYHEGFTMVEARGYWQGKPEPSCVVTIEGQGYDILATVRELGETLHQDAIGIQDVPRIRFLSNFAHVK